MGSLIRNSSESIDKIASITNDDSFTKMLKILNKYGFDTLDKEFNKNNSML